MKSSMLTRTFSSKRKSSYSIKQQFLFFSILLSVISQSNAANFTVSSASQFNNLNLSPGDVVTWTNGTYSNQNINFLSNGTAGNPIILKAESIGGVKFTGSSQLNFGGQHLVVEGFFWDGGTGTSDHIEFRRSGSNSDLANNCTLRNCAFDDLSTSGDNKSRWIVVYGRNNTIENCSFLNKKSTGACILVELRYQNGGVAGHQIRNNYFYNFPAKDGRTNNNDSEGIRIGVSSFQTVNAGVTVENNYFREVDGENEIISNKSLGNIYRNNTFRKCRGSLVLRHGAEAIVDGNYFLGENKAKSGGIRISDSRHVVINNYMQGLNNGGDSFNNGITLMGGGTSSGGTSSGYQNVENIVVAFNTIYNSDDPIHYNDSKGRFKPTGEIANNLIYSTNGNIVSGDISQIGTSMSYSGNIFGGSTIGISNSGITNANGNFSASGEIFKPSISGPVANAASGNFNQVTKDVEGRNRPFNNKDVGAHEISGASGTATNPQPLVNSNVGNTIGACFLNASGTSSTCSGTTPPPPPPPSETLTTSTLSNFEASASSKTLTINSNVNWSVSDNQSWINVNTTSGSNNGSVSISVQANTNSSQRTGVVTVSGGSITRTVNVIQVGASSSPPPTPTEVTNLALNKTVTATGTADGSNVPANIVDNSTTSRWSSNGFPKSFTIDLGAVFSISRTEMVAFRNRAYQFTVEASETNSNFSSIVNRSSNTTQGSANNPIADSFNNTNARFVRVNVTGASVYSGAWVSIMEFRVFGTATAGNSNPLPTPDPVAVCNSGNNLSVNGTIVNFSNQQSANPATNIIDGNTSNRWSANGFPQSVVIDLGDFYNVNQVKLHPFNNRAYQFLIEGSTTSSTSGFSTLNDSRGNTSGGSIITKSFNTGRTRFIRLTITGASGYSGPWASVREFEVICAGNSSKQISRINKVNFYPNPFVDNLTVSIPSEELAIVSDIRLLNLLGKVVVERNDLSEINEFTMPLSLPQGLYILQVIGNDGGILLSKKIIKK